MEHTFRVKRGDSRTLELTLTEPYSDTPFNPTGWSLLFTVKEDRDADDTAAVIQKLSTIGGFTTIDAATGRVDVELVPADFAGIDPTVKYFLDVQAFNTGTGVVKTVASGTIRVDQDVSKSTDLSIATYTTEPANILNWVAAVSDSGKKHQFTFDGGYFYLCIQSQDGDTPAVWRQIPMTELYPA